MEKNFVNYHILISHSPSCLNRDDMNMQKTAVFGGKRRVRISSQSLKRTMRMSDYYRINICEPSIRTKHIDNSEPDNLKKRITNALKARFDENIVIKTLELLSGKTSDTKGIIEGDSVAPWAIEEVAWFCEKVKSIEGEPDFKNLAKELKQDTAAFRKSLENGIDIALSGRMATSGLLSEVGKIDGALAVAHPITTHAVESDIDWFTAVDDLQELGSGHLDTQEFSSGVFYRYASLNIAQLQENLGGASREQTLIIAAHVLHMLATEVPSAKQQSFAAHNLADLALVSISDLPVSLINAFEAPITAKNDGLLNPSVTALHDYWKRIYKGYELNDMNAEFALHSLEIPDSIVKKDKISELESWIRKDGGE
ncbi:MAG: type I-E CRISPR-associated protein Cas7/Cse4/CasC [Deltaproteobacteria bacterium RIFOXYC2_FULL_48_10]|nr:MAG: type I-E CRISPR-associated protein Cas7/Cse4/CasC [Deltaproteobacteria bacterium RIFOXYC2_FULL_48_10]